MDINTASLILQKLTDTTLSRVLSLTSLLRPNDWFWQKRVVHRYKVELGKYAKMSYYDIYRELITSEQLHVITRMYQEFPVLEFSYNHWHVDGYMCLHKKMVERNYLPMIDLLLKTLQFKYIAHIPINCNHTKYIGPLISAVGGACVGGTPHEHLELVQLFANSRNNHDPSIMECMFQTAIQFGHLHIVEYYLKAYYSRRALHTAIIYDRYQIFINMIDTGLQKDDHRLIVWLIKFAIQYERIEFVQYLIDKFGPLNPVHILEVLVYKHISYNFFILLFEQLPNNYFDNMIEDIKLGRPPKSSRPFLSLFKICGRNVEIYHYLLLKYGNLPLYFIRKIIIYNYQSTKILEMILKIYPRLYDHEQLLLEDYKRVRSPHIVQPLMEILSKRYTNSFINLINDTNCEWLLQRSKKEGYTKLSRFLEFYKSR